MSQYFQWLAANWHDVYGLVPEPGVRWTYREAHEAGLERGAFDKLRSDGLIDDVDKTPSGAKVWVTKSTYVSEMETAAKMRGETLDGAFLDRDEPAVASAD